MLYNAVELAHPNTSYPLALFTDSSDHSVGGALQQLTPQGSYEPLGFYSAHLSETQKKYSVFKKELLGAHKSLRHFLPEVYGRHCTIWTDHLPLVHAFQSNDVPLNDPQVYRQLTEIGRFTKDVRHISGIDNIFADFLSRIPEEKKGEAYRSDVMPETPPIELASAETVQFQVTTLPVLHELQQSCPEIKLILGGDKPKNTTFGYEDIDGFKIFCKKSHRLRP